MGNLGEESIERVLSVDTNQEHESQKSSLEDRLLRIEDDMQRLESSQQSIQMSQEETLERLRALAEQLGTKANPEDAPSIRRGEAALRKGVEKIEALRKEADSLIKTKPKDEGLLKLPEDPPGEAGKRGGEYRSFSFEAHRKGTSC